MIRHAAAVVVALCLSTSPLYAQNNTRQTVNAASADVHKAPSQGSPVIGKAPRGTALVVTREVGDWVKVSWPSAADGAGYVRVTALTATAAPAATAKAAPATAKAAPASTRKAPASTAKAAAPVSAGTKEAASASASAPAAVVPAGTVPASAAQIPTVAPSAPSPARTLYVAPSHVFGVGAVAGSTGFGGSVRRWSQGRLGLQLEASRYTYDSVDLLSRATSTNIAPSLLFAMNDRVTDQLWLRPYVGVGAQLAHASRTDLIFPDATESANTIGGRVFVGGEMAFASVPQFSLSLDVGYYHMPEPFVGFEPSGVGFALSGHWYLK
jgi:hypothetical protein